jgi:hypothetical protein
VKFQKGNDVLNMKWTKPKNFESGDFYLVYYKSTFDEIYSIRQSTSDSLEITDLRPDELYDFSISVFTDYGEEENVYIKQISTTGISEPYQTIDVDALKNTKVVFDTVLKILIAVFAVVLAGLLIGMGGCGTRSRYCRGIRPRGGQSKEVTKKYSQVAMAEVEAALE